MEIVTELMKQATREEMEVFDKICRSSEERIQEEFGKSKELVKMAFMFEWVERIED